MDPFHAATAHLFADHLATPSGGGTTSTPYGLGVHARLADLRQSGFEPEAPDVLTWSLELSAESVRKLYATYSNVAALPPNGRDQLLDGLGDVPEHEFA
jgi:hypothetical protein